MNPDSIQLTPESFKQRILSKHPDGVASDGTPYAKMDAADLTKRVIQQFPDGTTQDGHKYSDFLPAEPQQPDNKESFGKKAIGVLNSIEAPFVGVGAIVPQLIAKALGKPDPYVGGFPGLGGSKVPVTDLSVKKKLGDIAQVGSYFVPGEGILGATGMGALQGGGSALSKGEDLSKAGVDTLIGGALGGGVAGGTKLAGMGLNKLGESVSGEGLRKAVEGIKNAYASSLNLNASERAFENRSGKDLAKVLVDNQVPLGRYPNNTLDASEAIVKLQDKLAPLNEQADQVLSHPQGVVYDVHLPDVESSIHSAIDAMTLPESDKTDAKKLASEYLKAEMEKHGADIPINQADKIKQGFWASTFDRNRTNLQNHIPYLVGKGLQEATEKAVAGTDTDISLNTLNQQRGDLIDAIRRLKKMDGAKLIKGGSLGNKMSQLTGAIVGSHFGPLQAIAGDYFGGKASEILTHPNTKLFIAKNMAKSAGVIPGLLGDYAKPIGEGISKLGEAIKSPLSVRGAGLISNLKAHKK